jgi:hypothetical protein
VPIQSGLDYRHRRTEKVRVRDKITQILGTGFIKVTEALEWRCEFVTNSYGSGPDTVVG